MRKLERSNPLVTCGSCRQFDGCTWCRRWNYHTASDAPICGDYRPIPQSSSRPRSGQATTVTG